MLRRAEKNVLDQRKQHLHKELPLGEGLGQKKVVASGRAGWAPDIPGLVGQRSEPRVRKFPGEGWLQGLLGRQGNGGSFSCSEVKPWGKEDISRKEKARRRSGAFICGSAAVLDLLRCPAAAGGVCVSAPSPSEQSCARGWLWYHQSRAKAPLAMFFAWYSDLVQRLCSRPRKQTSDPSQISVFSGNAAYS